MKMKVGGPIDDDVRRARIIRAEIGPDALLMMDANQVWDVDEAIANMARLAEFDPYWIEEPTHADDVLGHAADRAGGRRRSGWPPARSPRTGSSSSSCCRPRRSASCQVDACRVGGVNEVLAELLMAAKFGVPVCPHAGGVGLCEYVQHLAIFDYLRVGTLARRAGWSSTSTTCTSTSSIRYASRGGRYLLPTQPGYSVDDEARSRSPSSPSRTARHGGDAAAAAARAGPLWTACPPAARPLLRPGGVGAGIVHLGLGAFHRAHQAVYTEEAIAAAGGDWGIVGVAPRSRRRRRRAGRAGPAVQRDQPRPPAESRTAGGRGAAPALRHAAADPARGGGPAGRPGDPGGDADRDREGVPARPGHRPAAASTTTLRADLATDRPPADRARPAGPRPARPRGRRRRRRSRWSAATTCRPTGAGCAALVDRGAGVRPGRRAGAGAGVGRRQRDVPRHHGRPDRAGDHAGDARRRPSARSASPTWRAVAAEPFRQWVIEDDFPGGRPAWERGRRGAHRRRRRPWERLKLRTLNGVHSRAGLPRRAGRLRDRSPRRCACPGMRRAAAPADRRGHRAHASRRRPGSDRRGVRRVGAGAVRQPGASATARCRWRWTARRSCRSGCCTRSSTGGPPARVPRWAALRARGLDAVRRAARPTTGAALPLDDPLADDVRRGAGRSGRTRRRTLCDALFGARRGLPGRAGRRRRGPRSWSCDWLADAGPARRAADDCWRRCGHETARGWR